MGYSKGVNMGFVKFTKKFKNNEQRVSLYNEKLVLEIQMNKDGSGYANMKHTESIQTHGLGNSWQNDFAEIEINGVIIK